MAMNLGGRGRSSISEINITPLVDVMLVLLVIFMVTAPMISQTQSNVTLPATDTGQTLELSEKDIVLTIEPDKYVRFRGCKNCLKMHLGNIVEKVKHNERIKEKKKVYLLADRELPYRYVLKVMAKLNEAGVMQVGLVTNPQSNETSSKGGKK